MNKHVPRTAKQRAGEMENPEGDVGHHLGPWAGVPPPMGHPRKTGAVCLHWFPGYYLQAPKAAVYPSS